MISNKQRYHLFKGFVLIVGSRIFNNVPHHANIAGGPTSWNTLKEFTLHICSKCYHYSTKQ